MILAVVNRGSKYGLLDGVITDNKDILTLIILHIKNGTAKKIVDNDNTLMYQLYY